MAAVRDQLRRAIKRPGADDTYADVADDVWRDLPWLDWQAHQVVLDRRLNVVDTGTGTQPIVFLHGLGGNWQNWLLNIGHFAALGHRVVALDLPGHGESEMAREHLTIPVFGQVVEALCAQLDLGPVTVVGNSMGGFVGAELAVTVPDRVERLVLVSAAILTSEHARREPLVAAARAATATNRFVLSNLDLVVKRPRLRRVALGGLLRYPELLSAPLTWELLQGTGKLGYVASLDALLSYGFRERLPDVACPTLVTWGREDMLVPVEDAFEFEREIGPCARVEVFEDTGHAPMIERPSRFNALLEEFLAGADEPEQDVPGVDSPDAHAA